MKTSGDSKNVFEITEFFRKLHKREGYNCKILQEICARRQKVRVSIHIVWIEIFVKYFP